MKFLTPIEQDLELRLKSIETLLYDYIITVC